jgi:hypothetical protein
MGSRRRPIDPANLGGLSADIFGKLHRLSIQLPVLPLLSLEDLDALPDVAFHRFHHPLSDIFIELNGAPRASRHHADELRMIAYLQARKPDLQDFSTFETYLCETLSAAIGKDVRFRSHDVGLGAGRDGVPVLFPRASQVRLLLRTSHKFIFSLADPVLRATCALVFILNCHPFADGNGRLARVYFNYLLIEAGYRHYFPLSTIIDRSRGGFELAVRMLELKSDWYPIIVYIGNALGLRAVDW